MAATRKCVLGKLFYLSAALRHGPVQQFKDCAPRERAIALNELNARAFSSVPSRPRKTVYASPTRGRQRSPKNVKRSQPPIVTRFHTSSRTRAPTLETRLKDISTGRDSAPRLRKGRPSEFAREVLLPGSSSSSPTTGEDYVDKVGIPFGYRRDIAGKWQHLAGLNTESNVRHRGIWWLWLVKCNEAYRAMGFDATEPWKKQSISRRMQAMEDVRSWVWNTDIVGSTAKEESAEWKSTVKHVLASDACIDYKLTRLHQGMRSIHRRDERERQGNADKG